MVTTNWGGGGSPWRLTQAPQPRRADQLHQLVVAHVPQQALQAALAPQGGELVAAAGPAAGGPRDGGVVQELVDLAAVLLVLVRLGLLEVRGRSKCNARPFTLACAANGSQGSR